MKKNELYNNILIESLSNDGNGVAHVDGQVVFVPFSCPGDIATIRIERVSAKYAFGRIVHLATPGKDRISVDCPIFGKCGGCDFRHISYEAELAAKQQFVQDALNRIGHLDVNVQPIIGSAQTDAYRNKAQFPIGKENGSLIPGFYAPRSHRLLPFSESCKLQPEIIHHLIHDVCRILSEMGVSAYDEKTNTGLLRTLLVRQSTTTHQLLLCLVLNGDALPNESSFVQQITTLFPNILSIYINVNKRNTNVILSNENRLIYGEATLPDLFMDVQVHLTPQAFFQINRPQAERLIQSIQDKIAQEESASVLDLYCGTGTIGLSVTTPKQTLYGIDVVASAIESAKQSAIEMKRAKAHFICDDSSAIEELIRNGITFDWIITDPPRKGCSPIVLEHIINSYAENLAMISCNPSTLARDLRILVDAGYEIVSVQPYDFFPRTKHVETVCCLYHQKKDFISVPYEPENGDYLKQLK